MYQTGGTIETLLNKVEQHEYILPAIQREFVWRPDQICQLFDSLLQGYRLVPSCFGKLKLRICVSINFMILCVTTTSVIKSTVKN